MIRSAGARAGLAINPATPVEPYADLLPELDMMLLMTVEPGFGGQPFLDLVLPKLRRARELVTRHGGAVWLQVDGGVSEKTIERCAEAGADVFVAGSAVYDAGDPAAAVQALRAQAERATARAPWSQAGRAAGERPAIRVVSRQSLRACVEQDKPSARCRRSDGGQDEDQGHEDGDRRGSVTEHPCTSRHEVAGARGRGVFRAAPRTGPG